MVNKLYEEQSIQAIANAIRNKNGLTTTYKASEMAQAILNIPSGGSSEWQPDADWWDIKTILEEDIREYAGKAIILYYNSDDFTKITITSPCVAVATSDGGFYTSTTTHTWDRSKDKIASSDVENATPKYGTRYLILYFNTKDIIYTALNSFTSSSIYAIFKCNLTKNSTSSVSSSFFYNNRLLKYFEFVHDFNIKFGTNLTSFCYNCYSLAKLPDNIDTSSGVQFDYFCYGCYSLVKLPESLNTSNGTSFIDFCAACYSLAKLPDNLNTSKGINFNYFCSNCNSLARLSNNLNVSQGTSFNYFCYNCSALVQVNIKLGNISISTLNNSSNISINSLRYIADNAPTVTSGTTLTIGSTNITRAGGSSGYVVQTLTNKGWTVK